MINVLIRERLQDTEKTQGRRPYDYRVWSVAAVSTRILRRVGKTKAKA